VLIAGGGEQMTLRAVARLADACNFVDGDIAEIRHKLAVLRRHCDAVGRDYDTIEKTRIQPWLLGRNDVAVAAKRKRLAAHGALRGFVGTVSRGHRPDWRIPGCRRRLADQCRSTERHREP
jgi:alkanesulfonate monooxygenase SsuD/methylene tetrahydromethanopterin reductase-like flavin-dependent oxidoreductase (luciferase family)